MFGVFILITIFGNLVEQMMPVFVSQRTLYEARERPSKAYSWQAFLGANILVELAWNSVGVSKWLSYCSFISKFDFQLTSIVDCRVLFHMLVLPHRTLPQRIRDKFRRLAWHHNVPPSLDILHVHQHICQHDDCRTEQLRGSCWVDESPLHHDVCLLRVGGLTAPLIDR